MSKKIIDKAKKNKPLTVVIILGLLALGILIASTTLSSFDTYDVYDMGTVKLYSPTTILFTPSTSMTINADEGLVVKFHKTTSREILPTFHCYLYKSSQGVYGEKLQTGDRVKDGTINWQWEFDLGPTDEGEYLYFISFSGATGGYYGRGISGKTPEFYIKRISAPTYTPPIISIRPPDKTVYIGESCQIGWSFEYGGPSTATVTDNGVQVESWALAGSGYLQTKTYSVPTNIAKTHTIVFKLTPDDTDHTSITDEVTVTVLTQPPTPTTTTPPPTTTPTTTTPYVSPTTTTDIEISEDMMVMMVLIAAGAGILVVACIARSSLKGGTKK